jgi:nitrite reductase/ring-hydroxylating ferredoxin subunit
MPSPNAVRPEPTTVVLGPIGDFPLPSMRHVRAADRRLLVVTTAAGHFVTDHACPHEGYGLVQGDERDGVLTCAWHNWKFRLRDGRCLMGEEDLRVYPARVVDGRLVCDLTEPDPVERRAALVESLRRGVDDGYVGQMARDVVRLLRADADPVQVVWEAVAWGAPRAEYGFGHALASLVDCLGVALRSSGDARSLPIVTAFAGVADTERRRPLRVRPEPQLDLPARPAGAFRAAVEAEDLVTAEALLRGGIALGLGVEELRRWVLGAVSDHHLAYGHAAIYTEKAFDLVDLLGWDRADSVLPHLVPAIVVATREDRLPYMRTFDRAVRGTDLAALLDARRDPADGAAGPALHAALLGRDGPAAVEAAAAVITRGGGVEAVLDVVVGVAAHRLLRYDPTAETTSDRTDFGWLDITHVLTYASAARWAWRSDPTPDTLRLVLWTVFLAQYAGRRGYVEWEPEVGDPVAATVPVDPAGLCRAALEDRAGSWIVAAHLVKTTNAAVREAAVTGSDAPLAAAARLVAAPRRETFTALAVRKAVQVADGRVPD